MLARFVEHDVRSAFLRESQFTRLGRTITVAAARRWRLLHLIFRQKFRLFSFFRVTDGTLLPIAFEQFDRILARFVSTRLQANVLA